MSVPIQHELFVCTANICRSAYAEVLTAQLLGRLPATGLVVTSAGTHGAHGNPMDPAMVVEAERRGVDPAGFVSRPLTRTVIDEADLVLTAEASHRTFVLQERPVAVSRTFSLGQFASALADVPAEAEGKDLLRAVRRARATARPDEDVADPYRRGPEAAAAAAEHLDGLLDQILPRLLRAGVPSEGRRGRRPSHR